jgi:hypothetical protein
MSNKAASKFIGVLFVSRNIAHKMHLSTDSYAQHKALETFYEDIVDLADSLAEQYQGRYDELLDIPFLSAKEEDPIKYFEDTLKYISDSRYEVCPKTETSLQNVIDEIEGLLHSTLYKLRRLK